MRAESGIGSASAPEGILSTSDIPIAVAATRLFLRVSIGCQERKVVALRHHEELGLERRESEFDTPLHDAGGRLGRSQMHAVVSAQRMVFNQHCRPKNQVRRNRDDTEPFPVAVELPAATNVIVRGKAAVPASSCESGTALDVCDVVRHSDGGPGGRAANERRVRFVHVQLHQCRSVQIRESIAHLNDSFRQRFCSVLELERLGQTDALPAGLPRSNP